jgi:nucleotide-binding universal stress UspA family protein
MKTILVLTDFSIRARYAAEYATNIAIRQHANLLLCHIKAADNDADTDGAISPQADDYSVDEQAMFEDLTETAKNLKRLIKADSHSFKPTIDLLPIIGTLPKTVSKLIATYEADLVVMGSRRCNRIDRFLSGSRTHQLLDAVSCPVLLIPEGAMFKNINVIVYATDLTFNNQNVMNYLVDIAQPFKASIIVNYISPVGKPITIAEKASRLSLSVPPDKDHFPIIYHNMKGYGIKADLVEMTRQENADILTLVHKQYDFFEKLFHASMSKQMADSAIVPLLILPHAYSVVTDNWSSEELEHFCYAG